MDIKSKVLLSVLLVAFFVAIGFTYYQTIILKKFDITNTAPEEPAVPTEEASQSESASSAISDFSDLEIDTTSQE